MTKKVINRVIIWIIIIGVIIGTGILIYKGIKILNERLPSFEQIKIEEVYEGLDKDYIYVIYESEPLKLDTYPVIKEEIIYLPIDFVANKLNDDFFWDSEEKTLTYTSNDRVIRMKSDALTYYVNSEPLQLDMPITTLEDDKAYIPHTLLLQFSKYSFQYNKENDILIIDDPKNKRMTTHVTDAYARLRVERDENKGYIKKLENGEALVVYEDNGLWLKVRTKEGYIGYILKNKTSPIIENYGEVEKQETVYHNKRKQFEGKVNLVWHQVTNMAANRLVQEKMEGVHGLDVLSPTWFEIIDSEGSISNIADIDYVRWAHSQGYQVWALFKCFNYDHTGDVLSSTEKREKVIKQILAYTSIYELDGINIDFENVRKEDGDYFVQFIKEITPYLKNQGLIVSVDMYVPSAWTAHYGREEIGKVIDYLIVMGYDEHWGTSPKSGSVASIGFVERGIENTLKEVPKEKVILGLPYYTRLWEEKIVDGKVEVSSKAYSMDYAYKILVENNADIVWNEEVGQYYGEYNKNGKTYKIWLEEEQSIEEKVKKIDEYALAGAAGWKLGLEKNEIWNVLKKHLKQKE